MQKTTRKEKKNQSNYKNIPNKLICRADPEGTYWKLKTIEL